MVLRLPDSWSNWNLEMLVFEERGKPEYPEKNLSEQRREPTTNSTHIWRRRRELNPGNFGGRRVLSPLRHPCSPAMYLYLPVPSSSVNYHCQSPYFSVKSEYQAPIVQTLDSAIHRIKIYLVDNAIGFPKTYPLDSDLSGG